MLTGQIDIYPLSGTVHAEVSGVYAEFDGTTRVLEASGAASFANEADLPTDGTITTIEKFKVGFNATTRVLTFRFADNEFSAVLAGNVTEWVD
jgi:hypothetical protein